jgi:hypothetical protein
MTLLHRYAAIHGTTREQEAEYHTYIYIPPTKEELEAEEKEWAEIREIRKWFREHQDED